MRRRKPTPAAVARKVAAFYAHCISMGDSHSEAAAMARVYRLDLLTGAVR